MKKFYFAFYVFSTILDTRGQLNFIADSSFENYSYIPSAYLNNHQTFNTVLPFWYAPTNGTPDYYNKISTSIETSIPLNSFFRPFFSSCSNSQTSRTGDGYVGMFSVLSWNEDDSIRTRNEFIQTKFIQPFIRNHLYSISFFINRSHCSSMAFSNLGAYISKDSVRQYYSIDNHNFTNFIQPFKPQIVHKEGPISDTLTWTKIYGIYKASGGENWITIGHFRTYKEIIEIYDTTPLYSFLPNAYYFIDDVSIYEKKSVIFSDTICKGEKSRFTSNYNGPFSWYKNGTLVSTDSIFDFVANESDLYILKTPNTTDTFFQFVKKDAYFDLGKDTFLCIGDTVTKKILVQNALIQWNSGSTDTIVYINSGGVYSAKVSLSGCSFYDTIYIEERKKPVLNILSQTEFCEMDSIYIQLKFNAQYRYYWPYLNDSNSTIKIHRSGMYTFKIIDNNGCLTDERIHFNDFCEPILWLPNAFVPFGSNKLFFPKGVNIKKYIMVIYNRWGEKIFITNGEQVEWDGKYKGEVCPPGIYMYQLEYVGYNNKNYSINGIVELLQ